MTDKDRLYKHWVAHYKKHGYIPTHQATAESLNLSLNMVKKYARMLKKEGKITYRSYHSIVPVDNFARRTV